MHGQQNIKKCSWAF